MEKIDYREVETLIEKLKEDKIYSKDEIIKLSKRASKILNIASNYYYDKNCVELISNYNYDELSDALENFEEKTQYIDELSPTNKVGYIIKDKLDNYTHEEPALSLNKTKSRQELKEWMNKKTCCLSWKLDGLTLVLTYKDGKLYRAITRGNGYIGKDITHNAMHFSDIPKRISYKGQIIVRGESLISKEEFERINNEMEEETSIYKNPRNLVSGTIQQKDSKKMAQREVCFKAFTLAKMDDKMPSTWSGRLDFLSNLGFNVVEYKVVDENTLDKAMDDFYDNIDKYKFETDGLVMFYEDAEYGESLGNTSKFPRCGIAFKWQDEIAQTTLRNIIWSEGKSGVLTPTAVFDSVELEGTSVARASIHNLAILENLELGEQDTIEVYKANMIIPQIAKNITRNGKLFEYPKKCPYCNSDTSIKGIGDTKMVYCDNAQCPPKHIEKFTTFCSRDAIDIKGFSNKTIELFVSEGILKNFSDIFDIMKHKAEILTMEKQGEKSISNLEKSIEEAKNTTLEKLVYGLCIEGVGVSNAKLITKYVNNDAKKIPLLSIEQLNNIDGIGTILAHNIVEWFKNEENLQEYDKLLNIFTIKQDDTNVEIKNVFNGKKFVITGDLTQFKNRKDLEKWIVQHGGKVSSSVSKETYALINNDVNSSSNKNKEAKKLGVKILGEDELLQLV